MSRRVYRRFDVASCRTMAIWLSAGVLTLPACRTMPEALTTLLPGRPAPIKETTDESNDAEPQRRGPTQALGVSTSRPVVGESLPHLPRDGYCGGPCPAPLPYQAHGTWAPPGLKGPYPRDEYLHDGGDAQEPAAVSPEWRVQGLNVEDTVAHYDTTDGRTLMTESNCAYIYAPRFSSVRTVVNANAGQLLDSPVGFRKPERIVRFEENARVGTKTEQMVPLGRIGNLKPGHFQGEASPGFTSYALLPANVQQALQPYANLSVIRTGAMQGAEKARLAEAGENAIAWTKNDGVKVYVGNEKAVIRTGDLRAQAIYRIDEPTNARLRICKVASTAAAQPGDIVDFTLRFDNVGDTVLGNIVILDSLTTRLEFVPNSAQSSRKSNFSTAVNAADSLELRWEIDEPIEPGDGGIVSFRCRVR